MSEPQSPLDLKFGRCIPSFPVISVPETVKFHVDILGFTLGGQSEDVHASVYLGPTL
jgi:hypothetical protein